MQMPAMQGSASRANRPGAFLRTILAAACLVALAALAPAAGLAQVEGEPPPAQEAAASQPQIVPPLHEAIAGLSAAVADAGGPDTRYVLSRPRRGPLLDGYVAHLLATHLERRGLATRLAEAAPRSLDPTSSDRLPGCLLREQEMEGADLFVCCATGIEEGERYLAVAVFDLTSGRRKTGKRTAVHVPAELEPLARAEKSRMDPRDANWLELFKQMFPPPEAQQPDLDALLALAEGDYLLQVGLWENAARRFLAAAGASPERHFMLGIFALQLAGQGEEADHLLQSALKEYADSGSLYALYSWVSLRQDRPEDAVIWLDQALWGDMAREGLYRYARALMALEQGDQETAELELNRAAESLPQSQFAQAQLARFYRDRAELDKAIAHYRLAAATGGCTPETWAELAVVLEATGQTDDAIEALRQAFALRTDSSGITRHLAFLLKRKGQYEEALEVLRRAAEAHPCKPGLLAAYGEGAAEMWRVQEAEGAYKEAISANGGFAYGEVQLAAMLALQHRYREAQVRLMDLLAARPDYHPARIGLGRILGRLGHTEEALSLLAEASKSPEYGVSAHLAMAQIDLRAGRPDDAVRSVQIAAFARPDAETYAALSNAFLGIGDVDKAESAAKTALEKDPLSARAHLAVARVRQAQGQAEEARKEAAEALALCPYSVQALEFNGALWRAEGDLVKCVGFWQQALALNPWHAELHRQLADVLARELGDQTGALEHRRQYVELERMRTQAAR